MIFQVIPILPPIEARLEAMGIGLPTKRGHIFHPASADFARRLNHGPWDRIVRRRAQARVEAEHYVDVMTFFDLLYANPRFGRLTDIQVPEGW